MWSIKVIIPLLVCYASASPSTCNARVYFASKNFYNILHWDPVELAFPDEKVFYSILYKSDAMDRFQIKEECHNITALSCNLTAETASIYDIQYEARVLVNGSCHGRTTRFKPIADTIFGPPILSIITTVSSLYVEVTLPMGPNGESIGDIINRSTDGHSKNVIIYTLKITKPKWVEQDMERTTSQFVINVKNSQTEYCGHVVYRTLSEWGRSESQNNSFCATLPVDDRMLLPWLLISAALLTAVVMMLAVYMCYYVKGGKQNRMPHSLVTNSGTSHKVLQPPDRKLIISKPSFCSPSETVYTTIQVKPIASSVVNGGYSPQDITLQDCTGSSEGSDGHSPNPNPQDTSAQSSENYSVVAVHVPAEVNEDFQQATTEDIRTSNLPLSSSEETWNKGGMSPTLDTLHELDATESNPARPLLLDTVRNSNGQLMLSSFLSQLESSTGEVSPLTSERKPLLSDLIDATKEGPSLSSLQTLDSSEWSDSGCDDSTVDTPTLYSPSQPVVPHFQEGCLKLPSDAIFASGYKQNWMPEILEELQTKTVVNIKGQTYLK